MAILKLSGSTLIETLTASVIIIIVFMIASFSFNNVLINSLRSDDFLLQNRLMELKYFGVKNKIQFPLYEEENYWIISAEKGEKLILLNIENKRNGKREIIEIPVQ